MKRWFSILAAALVVGFTGWGVSRVIAQDNMDDMAMMKKMMMNRPKALKQADMTVQSAKQKAMKAGMYGCCLKHACDVCALKMGSCPCGKMASMDKPVCNECKGGWAAGDGAIPGKKADDIKTMPRMDMKMSSAGEPASSVAVGVKDLWRCPITGEAVQKGHEAGSPVVFAGYRVHFCCGGCPDSFAKLSEAEKNAKVASTAKLDSAKKG